MRNKSAIVFGGGTAVGGMGNGKATAIAFAREGARVLVVDRDSEAAVETCHLIREEGGEAHPMTADVTREGEVKASVDAACAQFGRLDIVHNNVGIVVRGGVVDIDEETWDRVFAVNLKSTYFACRHAIPIMAAQGGGSIINVSSIAGIRWTGVSYITYSTTKAAMNHLTQCVAAEHAPQGIRCNAIVPGYLETPMVTASLQGSYAADLERMSAVRSSLIPMAREGSPWDVANLAVFLASDDAKYVTGALMVVDGGITTSIPVPPPTS